MLQHFQGTIAGSGQRHSDAGREMQLVLGMRERVDGEGLPERELDAMGDRERIVNTAHRLDDHDELVTTEVTDERVGPNDLLEPGAERQQEVIAGGVPQAVVHHLEAVEVEQQHRGAPRRAVRACDGTVESIDDGAAIR